MKRLLLWSLVVIILITACGQPIDPFLKFSDGSYLYCTGHEVETLRDVTKAKTVVVVWFAAWCQYCQLELANLQAAYGEFQAQGIEIVGVAVSTPREDLVKFVREYGLTFPIVVDHGPSPINGIPFTVLAIDGQIRDQWIGATPAETILEIINQ